MRVVDEVLLELVEDQVAARRPRVGRLVERPPRGAARARDHESCSATNGVRLHAPQLAAATPARSTRRLADAALAVEHGQPRRQQVRDDHLALALAAEEEAARRDRSRRTRSSPCTGERGGAATVLTREPPRAPTPAYRPSPSTYSSSGISSSVDVPRAPELALERRALPAARPTSGSSRPRRPRSDAGRAAGSSRASP